MFSTVLPDLDVDVNLITCVAADSEMPKTIPFVLRAIWQPFYHINSPLKVFGGSVHFPVTDHPSSRVLLLSCVSVHFPVCPLPPLNLPCSTCPDSSRSVLSSLVYSAICWPTIVPSTEKERLRIRISNTLPLFSISIHFKTRSMKALNLIFLCVR